MKVTQKQFDEKKAKRKKNIIYKLNEYYGDQSEWTEHSDDLTKYAIFYNKVCSNWLEAFLLHDYEVVPFGKTFLEPKTSAQLDMSKFKEHHYSLLSEYSIDRAAVNLVLNDVLDNSSLEEASQYHYKHLEVNGYHDEVAVLSLLEPESLLSIFMPHVIVKMLLKNDYSNVISSIAPDIKSSEKIWVCVWHFLYSLYKNDTDNIEQLWSNIIEEWKACYINSNFYLFNEPYLAWVYYLYCEALDIKFDIRDLSKYITLSFAHHEC